MTEITQGVDPRTGKPVGEPVPDSTPADVDTACRAAAEAAPAFAALPLTGRAALLRAFAEALRAHETEIVDLADAETALGRPRLTGELARTTGQLDLFADAVEEGSFLAAIVDLADPGATPVPRPDLRRMLRPLGPVAVFGASNFPLAFSVAGGDTASALAAGCPVVVKAHPAHIGLSVLVARIGRQVLPSGVLSLVSGVEAGTGLVRHPAIKAVGFTGSTAGGRALFDLAAARPEPIPFYGELGSLNPVVVTPAAVSAELAAAFVASYTLGNGQFCTKPGLLFLPAGHGLGEALAGAVGQVAAGPLLAARIRDAYESGTAALAADPRVRPLVPPRAYDGEGFGAHPTLFAVDAADLGGELLEECFGPTALVVEYQSTEDLFAALDLLPGTLTAAVHATPDEPVAAALLDRFAGSAGRVIWGGWPTGVAVTWAQQHGGPWPATTSALHTSVGVTAIRRFLRPVAYQSVPDALLPEALRNANPLGIPRRVTGG